MIFNLLFGKKPSAHIFKLSVDGASKGNPGEAGSRGLFQDHRGDMIIAYATYIGISSSVYAEASAICFGLKLAQELGINNIWIETDSELLVRILNGLIDPPWGIHYMFYAIMDLIRVQNVCNISYILGKGTYQLIA